MKFNVYEERGVSFVSDISDPAEVDDALDDLTVLVHVGFHKTGTSWLQSAFFAAAEGLTTTEPFVNTHAAFAHPRFGEFSIKAAREIFAADIARARETGDVLVLSDEALGGLPFHSECQRELFANRIKAAFPNARLLVTVRNQSKIIGSVYGEYLRHGFSSTLDEFLAQETGSQLLQPILDLDLFDWNRALDFYSALFGTERTAVVPMEWALQDDLRYETLLSDLTGKTVRRNQRSSVAKPNYEAHSSWAQEVQRRANQFHAWDSRSLRPKGIFYPNSIAWRVNRMTPGWARKSGKIKLQKKVEQALGTHFAESNRAFSERTGYDLKSLGYVIQSEA